jgi:hypothetical protein
MYKSSPLVDDDWTILIRASVEVRQDRHVLRTGVVESVTADGNIVWLALGEGLGRQLVDKGSGYQILISPNQIKSIGKLPVGRT